MLAMLCLILCLVLCLMLWSWACHAGTLPACLAQSGQVSSLAGTRLKWPDGITASGSSSSSSGNGSGSGSGSEGGSGGGVDATTLGWSLSVTAVGAVLLGAMAMLLIMNRRLSTQRRREKAKQQEQKMLRQLMYALTSKSTFKPNGGPPGTCSAPGFAGLHTTTTTMVNPTTTTAANTYAGASAPYHYFHSTLNPGVQRTISGMSGDAGSAGLLARATSSFSMPLHNGQMLAPTGPHVGSMGMGMGMGLSRPHQAHQQQHPHAHLNQHQQHSGSLAVVSASATSAAGHGAREFAFVITDIEGSTQLSSASSPALFAQLQEVHDQIMREAIAKTNG